MVTYTASDGAGNSATSTREVVVDAPLEIPSEPAATTSTTETSTAENSVDTATGGSGSEDPQTDTVTPALVENVASTSP